MKIDVKELRRRALECNDSRFIAPQVDHLIEENEKLKEEVHQLKNKISVALSDLRDLKDQGNVYNYHTKPDGE